MNNDNDQQFVDREHRESVVIKRNNDLKKEIVPYIVYEFFGTFVLCYAFNITNTTFQIYELSFVLFIVTMASWEVSCSHFNLGITLTYIFADLDNFQNNWFKFGCAALGQLWGSVAAMFMARFATSVTEYNASLGQPASVNPVGHIIAPINPESEKEMKQQVLGAEFICSLLFFTIWIVIRKTVIKTRQNVINEYIMIVKPLFVALSYVACRLIFSTLAIGYMNPTIVFSAWIFDLFVYNNISVGDTTYYNLQNRGRFVWIYFFGALLAAPFAGLLSKVLLAAMNQPMDNNSSSFHVEQRAALIKKQNNAAKQDGGGADQEPQMDNAFKYEAAGGQGDGDGQETVVSMPPSVPDNQSSQPKLVVSQEFQSDEN